MKKEVTTVIILLLAVLAVFTLGCAGQDENVLTGTSVLNSEDDCSVTICYALDDTEVYCPEDPDACREKYLECRMVKCADDTGPAETGTEEYDDYYAERDTEYEYTTSDLEESACDEIYNDCYDEGQPITCKGPFELCDASFEDCVCGSEDDHEDSAEPEFDSGEAPDCDTGVYVCEKYSVSMDGTPTTSKVTCKSSFVTCSATYGKCDCGDSSLTDFGTITVGDAGGEGTVDYECEFEGKTVPCYMVVEDPKLCSKSSHTCKSGERWLQCEGSMPYCNNLHGGKCLCGVEDLGYGEYTTSDD